MDTRIVFLGSAQFSLPALKMLVDNYSVVGVVTQPDRPSGRGQKLSTLPVKDIALEYDIPITQPQKVNQSEVIEEIKHWNPSIIIVVAYGQILRSEILNLPRYGCLNIHASLLPRWRGAAPIQAAILHGDFETGVTIMKMDAGMDTGPIIEQRRTMIYPDETGGSLSVRLSEIGANLLEDTLKPYLQGEIDLNPQDESFATYAPMLKKADGYLDQNQPSQSLARQVRAFNPWPGTFINWQTSIVKIIRAYAIESSLEHMENIKCNRTIIDGLPALVTKEGYLVLEMVQPAGKRIMSGEAFLQGARNW